MGLSLSILSATGMLPISTALLSIGELDGMLVETIFFYSLQKNPS